MKHEYHEGPEAQKRFETVAKAALNAPKSTVKRPVVRVRTPKKTSKG
jgi:hypothetical protein